MNNTTDVLEEDDKNQSFNNTNQSQIDTNSPANNQEVNNTTITNTTIVADVEVENSTIKNRTNESTGAGDLTPDSGNPTSAPEDLANDAQSQPVTLESIMEDLVSESSQESSPSTVGVTQALSSSSAKVYEVSPKIISKKMTMDEIKYLIAFMLILMSALVMGFKRVRV
ncbi:MAG: hypothetical protein J6S29_00150 [Methanosphaera sp.]|nr:hypothetical protein [Methanosphaera sp.]